MLDIVHRWCCTWQIQINPGKTKVIHFRHKRKTLSNFIFHLGCKTIDYAHDYKYLGHFLNEFLDTDESIQRVYDSANRALGVLIAKAKTAHGFPLSLAVFLMPVLLPYVHTLHIFGLIGKNSHWRKSRIML